MAFATFDEFGHRSSVQESTTQLGRLSRVAGGITTAHCIIKSGEGLALCDEQLFPCCFAGRLGHRIPLDPVEMSLSGTIHMCEERLEAYLQS